MIYVMGHRLLCRHKCKTCGEEPEGIRQNIGIEMPKDGIWEVSRGYPGEKYLGELGLRGKEKYLGKHRGGLYKQGNF